MRPGSPSSPAVTIRAPSASCRPCAVPRCRVPSMALVDEVAALARRGVTEVTLLGQNVNSYGRDLTRRRPLFAELLRAVGAVEGIRRVRFTSPHPKDLRPETIAAMAETPAVCNHLHLPLQSGSDRVLAAMRRGYTADRYLARLRAARTAMPDLAVTTDLIVGFPGEGDDDFERTLEVVAEAAYDSAYTFVFSPRPGHSGRGHGRPVRGARGGGRAVRPPAGGGRAVGPRRPPGADRAHRGGHRRGPSKRDPTTTTGRTSPEQAGPLPPAGASPGAAGSYAEVRGHRGRPAPPGRASGWPPPPRRPTGVGSPWPADDGGHRDGPGRVRRRRGRPWRWSGSRPPASRPPPSRWPGRPPPRRGRHPSSWCRSTPWPSTAGMDIGTDKPGRGRPRRGALPPGRHRRPGPRTSRCGRSRSAAADALGGVAERGHRAVLVGGTGLYLRAVVDHLDFPAGSRRWLPAWRPISRPPGRRAPTQRRRHVAGLHRRLGGARPAGGRPHGAGQRASRPPGARGDPRVGTAVLLLRARARALPAHAGGDGRHPARPRPTSTRRIDERLERQMDAGFLDEVTRTRRPARRSVAHGAPGTRLPRAARPPRGRRPAGRGAGRGRAAAPAPSPAASGPGSAATPAS